MNATDYSATRAPTSNASSMPTNGNMTMTPNGNTPSMSPNVSQPSMAPAGARPITTLKTSGTDGRNTGWQIGLLAFIGVRILFMGP